MSRPTNSPSRSTSSPRRNGARSRRASDDFAEEFSRMLIERSLEFDAEQDEQTEQIQGRLQKALAQSIERHEAVRAEALKALQSYQQELERAEKERIHAAQAEESERAQRSQLLAEKIRRKQQEQAERELEEQKRIEADQLKLRETQAATEAARKRVEEQKVKAENITKSSDTPASTPSKDGASQQAPFANGFSTTPKAPPPLQSTTPAGQPSTANEELPSSSLLSSQSQRDQTHQRYLDLHQRLKRLRTQVKTAGPALQDWRAKRLLFKKLFGQIVNATEPKLSLEERRRVVGANMQRRNEIISIVKAAKTAQGPTVDAREFIVSPQTSTFSTLEPNATQVPAVFIYLLSMCAKAAINTIKSTGYPVVEHVGISISFVFGALDLRLHGEPFIDILLAKYHFVCPVLFGVSGPLNTLSGRKRSGWPHETMDDGSVAWIEEKTFFEEQQYLAVGWAALTLRDFAKASSSRNSCPPWRYWESISRIVNTVPDRVTRLHFVLLKNLLENHADKFVKFYGQAAVAALRNGIVVFPGRLGSTAQSTERSGVEFLRDGLRKKFGIAL